MCIRDRLALSHPEVSFKFVRDGKPQFQTPGDGKLLGAAYAVLSRDFAKDLVPVEHTVGSYTVRGLVTPPKNARASRAMQYFFINGRFVKNRTMMAALEAAYKGCLLYTSASSLTICCIKFRPNCRVSRKPRPAWPVWTS